MQIIEEETIFDFGGHDYDTYSDKEGRILQNIWFDAKSEAGKFTSGLYSYPTTYVVDKNGNIVGEPIVDAITAKKQAETLQKLIDQAIANSKG